MLVGDRSAVRRSDLSEDWLDAASRRSDLLGNTYYVGTRGLSSILIVSDEGHVLIDGGLSDSAPLIAANIAEARVQARGRAHDRAFACALRSCRRHRRAAAHDRCGSRRRANRAPTHCDKAMAGRTIRNSIAAMPFRRSSTSARSTTARRCRSGQVAITGHYTPGHTPGGMSWSWYSCEKLRCANFVYADSLTAVADEGFRFSDSTRYRRAVRDFNGPSTSCAICAVTSC